MSYLAIAFRRALSTAIVFLAVGAATAQQPYGHYRFGAQNPTGAVGAQRLQAGGPVQGYFQPVEITGPNGALLSLPNQAGWTEAVDGPLDAGMLIGRPYRVRVANIEDHPGREVYPTIEIIDRTYPPPGMERRFPIPIVITQSDLELALKGMLVTRVVYIEDPLQAIPGRQSPGDQLWHDAGPRANALEVADRLGRPVAIVRLGGRLPDESRGPDYEFLYGCPAWFRLPPRTLAGVEPSTTSPAKTAGRTSTPDRR